MLEVLSKKFFLLKPLSGTPTRKIFITLVILFLFRFGSSLPLSGIDQVALAKSFSQLENKNALLQIINMYAGGGSNTLLSSFSLGIIPFINASIFIDLLTALFPSLEKLQSEEGEAGRRTLSFYKKGVTLLLAIVQSSFLVLYLKPYFYTETISSLVLFGMQLVTGTMIMVWLSSLIDNKGIGNGTSLVIFTNIVVTLLRKDFFQTLSWKTLVGLDFFFLLFLVGLICISQTARITMDIVSARQLSFLENNENTEFTKQVETTFASKENGLSIRLNQAGIFPIIIASNIVPFFSYLTPLFQEKTQLITTLFYYLLIIGFNYFYTIVFWDPEKIAEQLRKASVSVVNITPGKETISYLENVVRSTSILGGIFLCVILFSYDLIKQLLNSHLLNQINISSLIILVGVAYEVQKTIRSLYKNVLEII